MNEKVSEDIYCARADLFTFRRVPTSIKPSQSQVEEKPACSTALPLSSNVSLVSTATTSSVAMSGTRSADESVATMQSSMSGQSNKENCDFNAEDQQPNLSSSSNSQSNASGNKA